MENNGYDGQFICTECSENTCYRCMQKTRIPVAINQFIGQRGDIKYFTDITAKEQYNSNSSRSTRVVSVASTAALLFV